MFQSVAAYDFFMPRKILFGSGRRNGVGAEVAALGRRCFVVSGSRTLERSGALDAIFDSIRGANVEVVPIGIQTREPLVSDVDQMVTEQRRYSPTVGDCVLAVGGGSAIDIAKAVAALATNREGESVLDYLEGVGRGLKIVQPPLPVVAMPTTSGTGAEATKNSVISSVSPAFKKSLRSDLMIPSVVVVDPELTTGLTPETTAYTGMDAITQLIESYVSRRAKPIPQALCLDGLRLAVPALLTAFHQPENLAARSAMSHAALLSGIALANSGLGMAHGVAAALGVTANVPHGLACAVMLPAAMRLNGEVARSQFETMGRVMHDAIAGCESSHPLRKWCQLSPAGASMSGAEACEFSMKVVQVLCEQLRIPKRLVDLGVRVDQIESLVSGSRGNSMDGNPREIDSDELRTLLQTMMG